MALSSFTRSRGYGRMALGASMSLLFALLLASCGQPTSAIVSGQGETRAALSKSLLSYSGTSGSITLSGMSGGNLTVSYASAALTSCTLYVSQGNGTGLVLAAQPMSYSSGAYSYTFSDSSFVSGAKIFVAVLANKSGVETCVPQGTLSDTTSWASFSYGSSSSSSSGSSGSSSTLSLSGTNGSVTLSGMSGGSLTVGYASAALASCTLYVSQGNGAGLVLAAQPMSYSSGAYSYTFSDSSFVSGAKIYIDVLANKSGAESCVPQGTLSNTTSWASFTYGSSSSSSGSASLDASGDPWYGQSGWGLSWHDEFGGSSVDTAKWAFDTGNNGGWGNNELENYSASNATIGTVSGKNCLIISAKSDYTSARLKTKGLYSATYGRIEARMKLPYGQGMWPAFWMLGSNIDTVPWPGCGEIDIMEMIGGDAASNNAANNSKVYGTVHWLDAQNSNWDSYSAEQNTLSSGQFSDAFHTFGVEWNSSTITWYIDGVVTGQATINLANNGTVFQKPYFLLLNLAIGGTWPGNPDSSTSFPQTLAVQWVRVYAKQ